MTSRDPIAESLERQSRFYAENPGAFDAYRGEDFGDHPCDTDDDGACSICGHRETCSFETNSPDSYDESVDYGGAYDGMGTVYSDADPSL